MTTGHIGQFRTGTGQPCTWMWLQDTSKTMSQSGKLDFVPASLFFSFFFVLFCRTRSGAATHCSFSRPTGRHSRVHRHISTRRWCTCHCCTWTQRTCRVGGKLQIYTTFVSDFTAWGQNFGTGSHLWSKLQRVEIKILFFLKYLFCKTSYTKGSQPEMCCLGIFDTTNFSLH